MVAVGGMKKRDSEKIPGKCQHQEVFGVSGLTRENRPAIIPLPKRRRPQGKSRMGLGAGRLRKVFDKWIS